MRKRIVDEPKAHPSPTEIAWLDLEQIAEVEVTSEETTHPIEGALIGPTAAGWRASSAGEQTIRLLFQQPQSLRHLQLHFLEPDEERQQEFALAWSAGDGQPIREIVRQQYQFSPRGAVEELEHYDVQLDGVRMLELKIVPDRSGGPSRATLARLRLR